jgi:hypothetical protein
MQTLAVVNLMLDTMGELPLNSLTDTHAMLATALEKLDETSRATQAKGWWFNLETVTLIPSVIDNGIYLPNDCLEIRTPLFNCVQRGNRIYNLAGGTFAFTGPMDIELIRLVEFEDLPAVAATYISRMAVHAFQTSYDGDTAKTRTLEQGIGLALVDINSAHTRNRKSNFLDSNVRLARLKFVTQGARRLLR